MKLLGRSSELKRLRDLFNQNRASLVVLTGRRRIVLVVFLLKNLTKFSTKHLNEEQLFIELYSINLLKKKLKSWHVQKTSLFGQYKRLNDFKNVGSNTLN